MRYFLYDRLRKALLVEIASGFHPSDGRFFSNRRICALWNVSRPTVKSALADLVRQGLLEVRSRSGYYVRPEGQQKALLLLHRDPSPKLPPPTAWSVKRFQLLPKSEDKRRHIAVILGGERNLPPEGLDHLPPLHQGGPLDYADGLFQEARHRGCTVRFYGDYGKASRRRAIVRHILEHRPDGVIGFRRGAFYIPLEPMIAPLVAARIPVVTIFDDCEQLDVASINVDNIGMGYDAVNRFVKLGHRRIAVLLPRIPNRYINDRGVGAQMAIDEARRDDITLDVVRFPLRRPVPARVVSLFRDPALRPTAVFVSTSLVFDSLWPLLRKLRLKVPDDVSILMCAGVTYLPTCGRSFDTLKIDFQKLGRTAVSRLLKLLEGKQEERATVLTLRYIHKGSVRTWGKDK